MNEISIYETSSGSIEVRLERETVWLSQEQMATLFDVQKAAISKHLKNIFTSEELERVELFPKWKQFSRKGGAESLDTSSISIWMRSFPWATG